MSFHINKAGSLGIVLAIYSVAISMGFMAVKFIAADSLLWNAFWFDMVATLIVFLFSYLFRNSSIYDPYWSVIPVFLAFYWFHSCEGGLTDLRNLMMFTAIVFWGVRLTFNWVRGWRGLGDEDWRYRKLAEDHQKYYWLVSLTGIHLLPTLIVFLACLPVYAVAVSAPEPLNLLDWAGFMVAVTGLITEMIADAQLRRFRTTKVQKAEKVMDSGLWAFTRHPNYLGEITFWAGLFVMALGASLANWWTVAGLAAVVLLFIKVSIPMMEARQIKRKPGYPEYMKKVPALFPGSWRP